MGRRCTWEKISFGELESSLIREEGILEFVTFCPKQGFAWEVVLEICYRKGVPMEANH